MKLLVVEVYAGYLGAARVVHLSGRSFFADALCGETVEFEGEPDGAVICDDCHELASAAGGEPSSWMVELVMLELRAAA